MAFITGCVLIDAPASALNNSGDPIQNARTENTSATKFIRTKQGTYVYVSAQAVRYWLRNTLEQYPEWGWQHAKIRREGKVAYTEGNPIDNWDDDLLGYMRAQSQDAREEDDLLPVERKGKSDKTVSLTRISPFRLSTFVSIEPVIITNDFGVMARQDGDPVPFEHQFYRTVLRGMFSLDLRRTGRFTTEDRSGYRNLDKIRIDRARERGLAENDGEFVLPVEERIRRVQALLRALARLQGGAKQTLHYTDVTPAFVIAAVIRGGNNIFSHVITAEGGQPVIHRQALAEALSVFGNDLLSQVYVGRAQGFMDNQADVLREYFGEAIPHPRQALDALAEDLAANPQWLE